MGRSARLRAALLALNPAEAAAQSDPTFVAAPPARSEQQGLSDAQRDACLAALERDSYAVLPLTLPKDMIDRAQAHIDGFCANESMYLSPSKAYSAQDPRLFGGGFHSTNIVETDPVFREFLAYKPAMQLCYDVFGPMFHLGQDKWTRKVRSEDLPPGLKGDGASIGWHSDGPIGFPEINGHVAMHTLRFGYFLSDAMHEGSGTVENIRGSHRSMHNAYSQTSLLFKPVVTNINNKNTEILTEADMGTDESLYILPAKSANVLLTWA